MPHKSTKLIAEELNRDYQAVLNFVHKVQKTAGNFKVRLEDVIEIDEVYPHAGSKGFKKESQTERQAQTWQGDCKVRKTAGGDSRSPKNGGSSLSCL